MAVEPRGVFTEEIDVLVAIGVGHARAFAVDDRQGERRLVDRRARVPARHKTCPRFVEPARLGIRCDVSRLRLRPPGDEIDDCAHAAILRPFPPAHRRSVDVAPDRSRQWR